MIDLEKEREAFSNWFESNFSNGEVIFGSDGIPLGHEKALSWKAWQAAKSQVPEDFVLVPKEPTEEIINAMHGSFLGAFIEGKATGGQSIEFAYKAMIEAAQGE